MAQAASSDHRKLGTGGTEYADRNGNSYYTWRDKSGQQTSTPTTTSSVCVHRLPWTAIRGAHSKNDCTFERDISCTSGRARSRPVLSLCRDNFYIWHGNTGKISHVMAESAVPLGRQPERMILRFKENIYLQLSLE